MDTIPTRFFAQARRHGNRPFCYAKRKGEYTPISWREAADQVECMASHLLARGVKPQDRVLILSENRPEWGLADLAIQAVGAWSVPVYPSLTAQDVLVLCRDAAPTLAFASTPDQAAKLLAIRAETPSLAAVVVCDAPEPAVGSAVISWAQCLAEGRSAKAAHSATLSERIEQARPEDTMTLIYTSGTTGEPKGVMLSHRNFLSNADACAEVIPITSSDLHLSFLPLSHVFERMAGWYLMISVGASLAYAETMDTIPANMLEAQPTIMLGVPRFFEKLYLRIQQGVSELPARKRRIFEWALSVGREWAEGARARRRPSWRLVVKYAIASQLIFKKLHARLGGRLRFFVSGSAPLSKDIAEFFYTAGITILEGYGLTETSPVIAVNRLVYPKFGSVGQPLPGVEVRIAEDGEILTRGPHVMQGYYRKPDATSAAIVDGWFHTGDIGHLDAEGFLHITDRKKDLIKTAGGKFVAPQKLENLFVTDPCISQAFVFGDKRPYCVALIVPNFEALVRYAGEQGIATASAADLLGDARVHDFYWQRVQAKQSALPAFEQVKKIALLAQEFSQASGELTPTLKARRRVIAERQASLLETLYQA